MNRLRAYRAIEGINQQDLGEILDVSSQTVSAIESGRRSFTGDLGALGYSNGRLALPEMSEPLHRNRSTARITDLNRARELLRLAGEVFIELRATTPKVPEVAVERLTPRVDSLDEIESLTGEVRCALQHEEHGPIRNLTAAVERAGVCIVPIAGLEGIDGLSAWVEGVPVIGLAPSVPGDRFRFNIAHELGHLLTHTVKTANTENEANRFAGSLLVPEDDFEAAMSIRPDLRHFVALKSAWGLSVAAFVYRAHDLGHVDDKRYRALQIQMSKWRKNEPATFDPVYGQLLGRMVEVNGGAYEVSRTLGINSKHLRELIDWRPLRSVA